MVSNNPSTTMSSPGGRGRSMTDLEVFDAKLLENIITKLIETIENSQEQIFDIAENARSEYARVQLELLEVKEQTQNIIKEVDAVTLADRQARYRLMEVSRDFHKYSEEDVRQAYEQAKDIQIRLFVLREKEANLRARRDDLERRVKRIAEIVERAEMLISQVGMMLKFISGNLQKVSATLDKAQRLQQLGWWVVQAQEEERKRVAREIHDGPAQSLANIVLRLEYCEKLWEVDLSRVRQELAELKEVARSNLQDIRKIIFALRPMALDDLGLVPALKRFTADFAEKYGLPVHLTILGQERRLKPYLEVAVFRVIQEALNNVYKHAQASQATVKLEMAPLMLTAITRDNGVGFNVEEVLATPHDRYGLTSMRERVEMLDGKLMIRSSPGKGTEVVVQIPLKDQE